MRDNKRHLVLVLLLVVPLTALLSACNTVSGAGRDVQKAGEVIEETAEDAKN